VAAKVVSQGATFAGTLLVARILPIADFGLVALAQVYLGFLQQFIDAGFLHALIQRPELTPRELGSSFWLLLAAGCLGLGATVLAVDLLDAAFRAPGLGWIIAVQSTILLFLPFRTVAQAVLSREVRVDALSRREAAVNLLRVGASVWLAGRGAGVWSLVLPQVGAEAAFSLWCYQRAGWRLTTGFSWAAVRPLARYGLDITLSRVVWFAGSRVDQIVVGRVLGPTALGLYSLAWQFAGALPQFASATLARVAFPLLARLQEDRERLRQAFLDVTRYTALAAMPVLAGLALVAADLVGVALKASWERAILPMQLLCALAFLRMMESLAGFLVNARGSTRRALAFNDLSFGATLLGVLLGAALGGLPAVAALVSALSLPAVLLFARTAMRECGGTLGQWLATLRGAFAATLVMGGCVAVVGALLPEGRHVLRLAWMVPAGVLAYALAVAVVAGDALTGLRRAAPGGSPEADEGGREP
jgi:O-antigen/teichoic acid export membrane protein